MDGIKALEREKTLSQKRQWRYGAKAASVSACSALAVCGVSLAVYFFRGAGEETVAQVYGIILGRFTENGIISLSLSSLILPAAVAVFAFFSGLSLTASPHAFVLMPMYGFACGTAACVLACESAYLCAAYSLGFMIRTLALAMLFAEASAFRGELRASGVAVKDAASARSVFSLTAAFAVPLSVLVAGSVAGSCAIKLAVAYITK